MWYLQGDTPESTLQHTPEGRPEHMPKPAQLRKVLRINLRFADEDPHSHAIDSAYHLWTREQVLQLMKCGPTELNNYERDSKLSTYIRDLVSTMIPLKTKPFCFSPLFG